MALFSLMSQSAIAVPPTAPNNISCQGWERDTVIISWGHDSENVTEYRVERNIDGGGWNNITTVSAGDPNRYSDTNIDTDLNHRYRVTAFNGADDTTAASAICNNRRVFETSNFRIFYGLRGTTDDCPQIDGQDVCLANINDGSDNRYVKLAGTAMEDSLDSFERVGFASGKGSNPPPSLDKIPVNVIWCDGGGCAGGSSLGLSPLLLETAFNLTTRVGDPVAYIVSLHEVFHFLQFDHPGLNDPASAWVYEGQARSIQDKLCLGNNRSTCNDFDDIDTGFAGYVPEVNGYMNGTFLAINESSYRTALFWTYLTEKFGTAPTSDTVEGGMNLMVNFWNTVENDGNIDGISALNDTLNSMGFSERFRDVWKDFSVANYAKNLSGPGVPAKYQYSDMAETGGTYDPVKLSLNQAITNTDQIVVSGEFVKQWGANYYEVQPDNTVSNIDIQITQDSSSTMYYTVLGIKGTDLAYEQNSQGRDFALSLPNDNYDKVVIIVTALDRLANYRYSINGQDPILEIARPTNGNTVAVGDPASPDKFLVAVELLDPSGKPLANVDLDDFNFTVGTEVVPAGNILTSATIQGQQWFVLRAPAQTSNGIFDLIVDYNGALNATEIGAVNYTPRNPADSMITIDRSGSMTDFDKMQSAKDAAKLFVDSWRTGDKLGLVSFANDVVVEQELINWSDSPGGGTRQTIFDLVDDLNADGSTSIGDAVQTSWDNLIDNGDASHDWAIVLLSDGLQTSGSATLSSVADDIRNATGAKPVIHAVALGPDADQHKMQEAANLTGGTYQYVSAPEGSTASSSAASLLSSDSIQIDLDQRYRVIASKIDNLQQIFNFVGPLQSDGDPYADMITIPVENGAAELVLSLSFDAGIGVETFLFDQENNVVPVFESTFRHRVWRVTNPGGGNWTLKIGLPVIGLAPTKFVNFFKDMMNSFVSEAQAQVMEALPPYLVHAALRSEVRMDVYFPLPVDDRIPAAAMPILASLTDTGPIIGASIDTRVTAPNGIDYNFTLRDNGSSNDGSANDGIYGAAFTHTQMPGSYTVGIEANGSSSLSGLFRRQDSAAFYIHGGGDSDNDGLPNTWEDAHGTDSNAPDGDADPDNDGSSNSDEFDQGSDPFNPDTDNGGEADGTDPNPLDPSDDGIEPTWVVAYPGDSIVHALYVLRPDYVQVDILRADNPVGPYVIADSLFPGDGLFSDMSVLNDQEYCYLVIAYDSSGHRSAPLNPSCTTPKQDAFAPHGFISINDNQRLTVTQQVTLDLWATDRVDPESESPHDDIIIPANPPNSGVVEMMISNDPLFNDAVWEDYASRKDWTLSVTEGLATVYVKYRDGFGNESDVAADSILLTSLDFSQCPSNPLGLAHNFNYFVFGDGKLKKSLVKGKMAIGGNADLRKLRVAYSLDSFQKSDDTIIVGSDIRFRVGNIEYGDLVYGGSENLEQVRIKNGSTRNDYPIDFGIMATELKLLSSVWNSIPTNGSKEIKYPNGPIQLEGSDSELNVFDISATELKTVNVLSIKVPKNASVLVNVHGEIVSLKGINMLMRGADSEQVVFNFAEATRLEITGMKFMGTVLAPKAHVQSLNNIFRSSLVSDSLIEEGSIAMNSIFEGCLPLPPTPISRLRN